MKRPAQILVLAAWVLTGLSACKSHTSDCIGTPGAHGEWKPLAARLGDGTACTLPSGDLEVRYPHETSDALVKQWTSLIPDELGLAIRVPWRGAGPYREATYIKPGTTRPMVVQVMESGGPPVRVVRLTWMQTAPGTGADRNADRGR